MKKCALLIRLTLTLVFACSLTPYVLGSEWWYMKEGGDWAQKEKEVAKALEQAEAVRIKIAESPGLAGESEGAALKRIITAESQALEQERQEREQKRQAQEETELAEILKVSAEQAELENRQRAEREERAQKEREDAEKARQEQERQQRQERERITAQQKALAEQQAEQEKERAKALLAQAAQAQKEREQKERQEKQALRAEQAQQEQEAKALADALRAIQEFEEKAAQAQAKTPQVIARPTVLQPLSRQELEDKALADALAQSLLETPSTRLTGKYQQDVPLEDINKQLEQFEQAAYEQELKQSAPFLQAYAQAISAENMPKINIIRPEVIQQKKLECGYFAAINGALLYNAFRSPKRNELPEILTMLKDPEKIAGLLTQAQDELKCIKTLNDADMFKIVKLYNLPDESYGFYSGNLLYSGQLSETTKLPNELYSIRRNKDIDEISLIDMLKKLLTTEGFTHIFFLYKSGADIHQKNLGHWISVVAHNNDNRSIDLYILDSQYPQSDSASDRHHRMNHDKMWQALAILLYQTGQKLREEQPD